jgi:hypothetical protein
MGLGSGLTRKLPGLCQPDSEPLVLNQFFQGLGQVFGGILFPDGFAILIRWFFWSLAGSAFFAHLNP